MELVSCGHGGEARSIHRRQRNPERTLRSFPNTAPPDPTSAARDGVHPYTNWPDVT